MKSNVIAKTPKNPRPQNQQTPALLTRKAVLAFAVYATLDTDLAVCLELSQCFPKFRRKR